MRIEAVHGDITVEAVEAIVNAANAELAGGGGVDGAIHRAAGVADLQAACRALGGCPTGEAVATPGFALAARWIIHTVGPIYDDGTHGEADLLASCYRRSLAVADQLGARSIAFPAISTGVYRFPRPEAADIAIETIRATTTTTIELVRLVAFEAETLDLYRARLD